MTNDNQRFERASRLKLLIESLNLTGKTFAKSIGMTQGAISNITNGKRAITIEFIDLISLRHSQLNPNWLLFGEGTMFKGEDQNQLNAENLPPHLKTRPITLHDLAEMILSIQEENKDLRKRLESLEEKINGEKSNLLP